VEQNGPNIIVTPLSDLDEFSFDELVAQAGEVFERLNGTSASNVVVDMCRVESCQSSAFGFFVKVAKRVKDADGKMAFGNVSARIEEVMKVLNLDKVWVICGTQEDALAEVEK
jgi:anti-anti-sigma factor